MSVTDYLSKIFVEKLFSEVINLTTKTPFVIPKSTTLVVEFLILFVFINLPITSYTIISPLTMVGEVNIISPSFV
jgi:hypothetical protein